MGNAFKRRTAALFQKEDVWPLYRCTDWYEKQEPSESEQRISARACIRSKEVYDTYLWSQGHLHRLIMGL